MRLFAAILLGKLIIHLTKLLKIGGGSAAPGLYALDIEPNLVERLSSKIPKNIVITGTNGKTTTSKLLAHFAKESKLKIIRNHTGSNLERGIASTLLSGTSLFGYKLNYDLGIWELDEAAFNNLAPKIKPDLVVFLNVFRDQLDRYGEVDSVVKKWCKTLKNLPSSTTILINADDANTAKLAEVFKGKVKTFGVKDYKIAGEEISRIKEKERPDFEASNVLLNGLNNSTFKFQAVGTESLIDLPLPGLYHIYDALAAISSASLLNFSINPSDVTKTYIPAFGRVEKLPFGYIFLIKNPVGATQVLETIAPNIKPKDRLLLALNDKLADGTDVSWIWDAQFEKLHLENKQQVITSGLRAEDITIRLKYAGLDPKQIIVEPDLHLAFKQARSGLEGHLFILPTYTAMLELQSILAETGLKKQYWQEE